MSSNDETEFKFGLDDSAAVDRLLRGVPDAARQRLHQINWIFDTDDGALNRNLLLLRLRQENDRSIVTAKGHSREEGGGLVSRPEIEIEVSNEVAEAIRKGTVSPLAVLESAFQAGDAQTLVGVLRATCAASPLRVIGAYETERTLIPIRLPSGPGIDLAVDRTSFPGGRVEYEIEVEVGDEVDSEEVGNWIQRLFREAGLPIRPSGPKVARLFAALRAGGKS